MTVCVAVLRRETRHDKVRLEFSDDPDDIRENFFPVPDAQSFLRRFGKTEIVGASEKLATVIDPPCGEQFLRANDAKLIAQLGPDQILAAITAGEREISGVVKRPIRPISNQARVLVVRMRRDIKDAAKHVQFLKRETNLCRIHRLRRLGGASETAQNNGREHSRHKTTRDRKHGRFATRPADPDR